MKCFFLSTLFLRSAFAFFYLDNEPEIDFEELWSKVIYEENLKSEVEDQKAQNSDNNPLLSSHDSPVSKRSMDDDPALVRKAKKSRANPDVDTNFTTNEPDYSFLPPVNAGSIISTPQQNDYPTTLTTLTVDNFDDTLHPLSRLITTPLENPADAIEPDPTKALIKEMIRCVNVDMGANFTNKKGEIFITDSKQIKACVSKGLKRSIGAKEFVTFVTKWFTKKDGNYFSRLPKNEILVIRKAMCEEYQSLYEQRNYL